MAVAGDTPTPVTAKTGLHARVLRVYGNSNLQVIIQRDSLVFRNLSCLDVSRLSTQPANVLSGYRKRESTASETTMTTLVGGSNNGARSNGKAVNSPFLSSENAV